MLAATVVSAIATVIIALFTIALAYSAYVTDKHLEIVERGYLTVTVSSPSFERQDDGHYELEVVATIANVGKTPARIIAVRGYLDMSPSPPQRLVRFDGSDATLPPGIALAGPLQFTYPTKRIVSRQDLDQAESLAIAICFVGEIRYSDVFGKEYRTGFCYRLTKGYSKDWRFKFARESELNYMT